MKPWQIVVALLIPGGLVALAVLVFLKGPRDQGVSEQWRRDQLYDRSGY